MKKTVFIVLGFLFVSLGIIGIFLPLVPTTVFLLIASYFFMNSSPELNERLLNNKYLGKHIKNYKEKKGMSLKSKITSICLLWISILLSAFMFTEILAIRILLIIIAIGVTIHIASLNNLNTQSVLE